MKMFGTYLVAAFAASLAFASLKDVAFAENSGSPGLDFYRGKQLHMIIRAAPGGGYDIYSRLLAQFLVNHIPGNPTYVTQNMPAAGGIAAANYVGEAAPRDGTVITLMSQSLPLEQAIHLSPGLTADLHAFNWIGTVNDSNLVTYVWHANPVKTIDDARRIETTIGATGAGDAGSWMTGIFNKLLGTKFQVINGYQGGNEIRIAMERGEVAGYGPTQLSAMLSASPDYLSDHKVSVLVQIGVQRDPKLPGVPLLSELGENAEQRDLLTFISTALAVGYPVGVAPGVPKDRVEILRKAFDETMADPDFLAEARKARADIAPISGAKLQERIDQVLSAPADLKAKVRAMIPLQ